MPSVTVKNLSKTYFVSKYVSPPVLLYHKIRGIKPKSEEVKALKNISFEVEKGEIFGIIGPDGAGKTTLFRVLTTLLLPDVATPPTTVLIENYDVVTDFQKIRDISGYMPGKFSLYMDLTVEENLNFFATLFNTTIEENYYLIKDIYQQIEPFKDRKAGALSGGMKQKLALSCALIHKPQILFLDEPTTGVDPVSRKEFWEMLRKLRQQGITILVSTPYMDEASLCDRIALIQEGRFLHIDTPQNIVAQFPKPLYAMEASENYKRLNRLKEDTAIESVYLCGEQLHLTFKKEVDPNLTGLTPITPTIEDCFIQLMRK